MPKSNFSRFSDGVQISGVALNVHQKGVVLYVCNSTVLSPFGGIAATAAGDGKTPERPYSTIAAALTNCVANRGDKIVVLPGHAETISAAAGIDLNVAGVEIIGVGKGAQRPTITLAVAATATLRISANDVAISNILFVANFADIATCIVLTTALNATIDNCEFRDTTSVLNFLTIVTSSATTLVNNGLQITNNKIRGLGTTAATFMVSMLGNSDRVIIANNDYVGIANVAGALLTIATGKSMLHADISENNVVSGYTGAAGTLIVADTASTGVVRDNKIGTGSNANDLLATASLGFKYFNNLYTGVADASGFILPAQDS